MCIEHIIHVHASHNCSSKSLHRISILVPVKTPPSSCSSSRLQNPSATLPLPAPVFYFIVLSENPVWLCITSFPILTASLLRIPVFFIPSQYVFAYVCHLFASPASSAILRRICRSANRCHSHPNSILIVVLALSLAFRFKTYQFCRHCRTVQTFRFTRVENSELSNHVFPIQFPQISHCRRTSFSLPNPSPPPTTFPKFPVLTVVSPLFLPRPLLSCTI